MTKRKSESSPYIEGQRREYSLYVMQQRAIPAATDGLKAGGRRTLWVARTGEKWKSANLAGATMPIHPHDSPEGAINTLAAPYGNNIPLFSGDGAFGTLLNPTGYGASRYTSVKVSPFTKDVVFRDIEIIPMMENYDGTLEEPVHFLPLVPVALLNPASGIAVGYATNILPRKLDDLINIQLAHLKGTKKIDAPIPTFLPLSNESYYQDVQTSGRIAYYFSGSYQQQDTSTLTITKIPYSQTHEAVIKKIADLMEKDIVVDYTDNSKNKIDIQVKFRRGYLRDKDANSILSMLGLIVREIENPNILSFDGKHVMPIDPVQFVRDFTDWRLGWYVNRYERLRDLLKIDLQRYYDIRTAIKNNAGSLARKIQTRSELKDKLQTFGIVYLDYIADLPIYRFTEEERIKNEKRIEEAEKQLKIYEDLLSSEDKRKKVYVAELQDVLSKYSKGQYD